MAGGDLARLEFQEHLGPKTPFPRLKLARESAKFCLCRRFRCVTSAGEGPTGRFISCNRRNARLCSGAAPRVLGTRAVLVPVSVWVRASHRDG
jgi:hypothetical protein